MLIGWIKRLLCHFGAHCGQFVAHGDVEVVGRRDHAPYIVKNVDVHCCRWCGEYY